MNRQYLVAISFVVFTGCVAMGIPSLYPPQPPVAGITHGNFERVKIGMTTEEVEAILGSQGEIKMENGTQFQKWNSTSWAAGHSSTACIEFRDGRVIHKAWSENEQVPQLTF